MQSSLTPQQGHSTLEWVVAEKALYRFTKHILTVANLRVILHLTIQHGTWPEPRLVMRNSAQ